MVQDAPILKTYLRSIQADVANGIATEHTYRPALKAFVESLGTGVTATNEAKRVECGAPDFTVSSRSGHGLLTIGYLEAKDVGTAIEAIDRTIPERGMRTIGEVKAELQSARAEMRQVAEDLGVAV